MDAIDIAAIQAVWVKTRASVAAYQEHMAHMEGWCVRGCGRKAGMSRICPPCTQKEYRAKKRKKS